MSLSDVADLSMSPSDVAVPINGDAEHRSDNYGEFRAFCLEQMHSSEPRLFLDAQGRRATTRFQGYISIQGVPIFDRETDRQRGSTIAGTTGSRDYFAWYAGRTRMYIQCVGVLCPLNIIYPCRTHDTCKSFNLLYHPVY